MTPANGWRVARPTRKPQRPDAAGILQPGVDALPVRVTIVQNEKTTGWDDGALGFEEAAVWFNGKATSFRLAAGDLLPGRYKLSRHEAVTDGEALRQGLPLRHPERDVWVRIELLNLEGRKDWEDEARLIREIKRLRALAEGGGESQYPPLARRPGLPAPPGPRSEASLGLQTAGMVAWFVAFIFHERYPAVWPFAMLAAFGFYGAAALRQRYDDKARKPETAS